MDLKRALKSSARWMGLDVCRLTELRLRTTDAFAAQKWLLRETVVRTIFDVGANVGQTAQRYHEMFPAAEIYSFEPFEEAFRALDARFRGVPQVRPRRFAVAEIAGARRLFVNRDNVTNSLLPNREGAEELVGGGMMQADGAVDVPTVTIDEFCSSEQVSGIDILKLDIQGSELMALQGARGALARHAVSVIYSEVWFAEAYQSQADFPELVTFLRAFGYHLYGLYDLNHRQGGRLAWADAIFVSPRVLEQAR